MKVACSLRKACADQKGSATVEFVLWLPFFFGLLALITDVSLLLNMRSRMFDAARDASRQVALSRMTADQAEVFAEGLFGDRTVTAQVITDAATGMVTTRITSAFSESMVFGRDMFDGSQLRAAMTMLLENEALASLESEAEEEEEVEEGSGN